MDNSDTDDRSVVHSGIVPRGEQQKFPKVPPTYEGSMGDGPSRCAVERVYINLAHTGFRSMSSHYSLVIVGFLLPATSRFLHCITSISIYLLQQPLHRSLER